MQHFDLSPLYRASIGFDQVSDLMNRVIVPTQPQRHTLPVILKKADDLYSLLLQLLDFPVQI